jgi:hypothetical protein
MRSGTMGRISRREWLQVLKRWERDGCDESLVALVAAWSAATREYGMMRISILMFVCEMSRDCKVLRGKIYDKLGRYSMALQRRWKRAEILNHGKV